MQVTVAGAGGIGGYYGGLLAAAGHRVTYLCRGAHLEAVRRQGGMRVRTVHGELFGPGAGVGRLAEGPPADLVLVAVKSFDTRALARELPDVLGNDGVVLSLQNGVDNEEVLAEHCGADRVLGGVAYILTTIASPGVIHQSGGPRTVMFGEWRGGPSARVARLTATFEAAGILATPSDDVVREKWVKYAFICAQAGMTCLTRLPIGEIRQHPASWAMFRQILEEVVAVGRARGVRLGDDVVERHLALARQVEPHVTSSLFYDLVHGKPLELEALHGTVVRYAAEAGIPVPACQAVYAALAPNARGRRQAGEG